jgi:hypothetical protein
MRWCCMDGEPGFCGDAEFCWDIGFCVDAGFCDGGGLCGGGGTFFCGEVVVGEGEVLEEEAGSAVVDAVAGETAGDLGDGLLEVVAGGEVVEEEGLVLDDGGDVVGAVVEAHVVVVHGGASAAPAVLFVVVEALVRTGWVAALVLVGAGHGFSLYPPPGGISHVGDMNDGCGWVCLKCHSFCGDWTRSWIGRTG